MDVIKKKLNSLQQQLDDAENRGRALQTELGIERERRLQAEGTAASLNTKIQLLEERLAIALQKVEAAEKAAL